MSADRLDFQPAPPLVGVDATVVGDSGIGVLLLVVVGLSFPAPAAVAVPPVAAAAATADPGAAASSAAAPVRPFALNGEAAGLDGDAGVLDDGSLIPGGFESLVAVMTAAAVLLTDDRRLPVRLVRRTAGLDEVGVAALLGVDVGVPGLGDLPSPPAGTLRVRKLPCDVRLDE